MLYVQDGGGGGGGGGGGISVNVAVQFLAALIVTTPSEQSASPLQPAKVEPASGVAVRVTTVFSAKLALHVSPQLIPAGALVTVPLPVPAFEITKL